MILKNGSGTETRIYMPVLSVFTDTVEPTGMRPYHIEGQDFCLTCSETYTFQRVDGKPKCHRCDGWTQIGNGR